MYIPLLARWTRKPPGIWPEHGKETGLLEERKCMIHAASAVRREIRAGFRNQKEQKTPEIWSGPKKLDNIWNKNCSRSRKGLLSAESRRQALLLCLDTAVVVMVQIRISLNLKPLINTPSYPICGERECFSCVRFIEEGCCWDHFPARKHSSMGIIVQTSALWLLALFSSYGSMGRNSSTLCPT